MKSQKSKNSFTPLSWKPKRIGPFYCAPACGRRCTFEEFQEANKNAKKLCDNLNRTTFKGWKPEVWENLGWHYKSVSACGRITVHSGNTAFLGEPESAGGRWCVTAKTPRAAVRAVIAAAKRDLAKIGALIEGFDL